MRDLIVDYIESLDIGTYKLSSEQPWSESDTPLYVKNLKTLYVATDQTETETLLATLDGSNIQSKIVTVTLYFSNDAKSLPHNYASLLNQLLEINDIEDIETNWNRKVANTSSFEGDILITQVDYIFTKLQT